MTATQKPSYGRSQISSKNHWILDEIPDFDADALDAVCQHCKVKLSWGQWLNSIDYHLNLRCHSCAGILFPEMWGESMPRASFDAVQDPGYFDQTWYHASDRRHWAQEVRAALRGELLIHAGTRLSALSRADTLYEETGKQVPIYLHSFRLRSTKSLSRIVLDDACDLWQDELTDPRAMAICPVEGDDDDGEALSLSLSPEGYRGAPYYNRYEIPGDISLLVHAGLIQLNTVETVELQRS